MNTIFKHTDERGNVHLLQKAKRKERYLYIYQTGNGNTKGWKWLSGEEEAKRYVMKITGKNPFKEVKIEEDL